MKKTILILLLSCMLTGCYNRHEKELVLLCDSLRKESPYYGSPYDNTRLRIKELLANIENTSSTDDLCKCISKTSSGVVKTYLFKLLLKKDVHAAFEVYVRNMNDKRMITIQGFWMPLYKDYMNDVWLNLLKYKSYKMSPADSVALDSLLVFKGATNNYYSKDLYRNLPINDKIYRYAKIRYTNDRNLFALIYLARCKNPKDIKYIEKELQADSHCYERGTDIALKCVSIWPHHDFKPILEKMSFERWKKRPSNITEQDSDNMCIGNRGLRFYGGNMLCAIASYDKEWQFKILDRITEALVTYPYYTDEHEMFCSFLNWKYMQTGEEEYNVLYQKILKKFKEDCQPMNMSGERNQSEGEVIDIYRDYQKF